MADDLLVTDEVLEDPLVLKRLLSDIIERLPNEVIEVAEQQIIERTITVINQTGAGGAPITVQDEGVTLTTEAKKLNFQGFTVTEPVPDEITIRTGLEFRSNLYAPGYDYTKVDSNTFTIDLVDATNLFRVGRRIRFGNGSVYSFGVIASRDYNSTNPNDTTVNMTMEGSGVIPSTITELHFVSSDTAWSPIAADPFNGDPINAICTGSIGAQPYWIVVGNNGKAFYSTDGGTSWNQITTGTTEHLNGCCYNGADEEFYIVGDARTFLISTNGKTFSVHTDTEAETIFTEDADDYREIRYNHIGAFWILRGKDNSLGAEKIVNSSDNFVNFHNLNITNADEPTLGMVIGADTHNDISGNSSWFGAFSASPTNTSVYYVSYADTTFSTAISTGTGTITASFQFPDGTFSGRVVCGYTSGDVVTASSHAATEWLDDITFTHRITAFAFDSNNLRLVAVGDNAQLGYIDQADMDTVDSWTSVATGLDPLANFTSIDFNADQGLFIAVADNGQMLRSSNGIN